jgi:hypothetical protein
VSAPPPPVTDQGHLEVIVRRTKVAIDSMGSTDTQPSPALMDAPESRMVTKPASMLAST